MGERQKKRGRERQTVGERRRKRKRGRERETDRQSGRERERELVYEGTLCWYSHRSPPPPLLGMRIGKKFQKIVNIGSNYVKK